MNSETAARAANILRQLEALKALQQNSAILVVTDYGDQLQLDIKGNYILYYP